MLLGEKPVIQVSVRALVEFVLRTGDLGGDHGFVGANRALAGLRGHQRVQRARPSGYLKEVPVSFDVDNTEFTLRMEGRIDGILDSADETMLEEIKTVQNSWDGRPDPLHWAQARMYAFMLVAGAPAKPLVIQLTYLNLETGEQKQFQEKPTAAELTAFFQSTTASYIEWLREHRQRCSTRDVSIANLRFPFAKYRPGQRELMVAAYKRIKARGRLFVEAPTGIGKTISVLFPAIKALGEGRTERVFYLTARGTGQIVAQQAIRDLVKSGLCIHSIVLTAKEKICVQEGQACDPANCPLAKGYYDRRKAAMRAALDCAEIPRSTLEQIAQSFQVCPFELSLDLSVWVDVVICDYNYVFDPKVYLRRHLGENGSRVLLLVDEAHNLIERARGMFSAAISSQDIHTVQSALRKAVPRCARAFSRLNTALRRLVYNSAEDEVEEEFTQPGLFDSPGQTPKSEVTPERAFVFRDNVQVVRDLPCGFQEFLDEALKQAEQWLSRNEPAEFRDALLEVYFQLYSFRRTLDLYDEQYVTLIRTPLRVELFCIDPSKLLQQVLEKCTGAILFSATLSPLEYFRELLGGREEDQLIQLGSPFPREHLAVLVHEGIRTQYKDRSSTGAQIAEAIGTLVMQRPGNYLVYLPSYDYLKSLQAQFAAAFPDLRQLVQKPFMSESDRETFLKEFAVDHGEWLIGWAVLGGVFSEGVDLQGDRLIGAIVVGVGLPQLCAERDVIRDYFQSRRGNGFEYAYTFPGMNRVLQAVGRVIRSESDHGLVLLIDTRYREARYRGLFPGWWVPVRVCSAAEINKITHQFWSGVRGCDGAVQPNSHYGSHYGPVARPQVDG